MIEHSTLQAEVSALRNQNRLLQDSVSALIKKLQIAEEALVEIATSDHATAVRWGADNGLTSADYEAHIAHHALSLLRKPL